jgi:hypothetical protein
MEPRPAATVIVARPAPGGVEVLALRRSDRSRFAPGFVVFPGGVIESKDRELAVSLFGDPEEAPRACALRELYGEALMWPTLVMLRALAECGSTEDVSGLQIAQVPRPG